VLCFRHDNDDDDHGARRANTARALAWWRRLGASHEATDMLHRAMCLVSYFPFGMVITIAVESVTFLFFRRLESKLVFILFLYQFIDLDKSLQPPPPPTPRPPRICAGSGASIKSMPREGAEAHHGDVVCELC
jgi:hypothetical protein